MTLLSFIYFVVSHIRKHKAPSIASLFTRVKAHMRDFRSIQFLK